MVHTKPPQNSLSEMDLLYILLCYVVIFSLIVLLVLYRHTPLVAHFSLVFQRIIPPRLIDAASDVIEYVFYTRNHIIQLVYCALIISGHIVLILDVLPILYLNEPNENHVRLQLITLFMNSMAYLYATTTNPGVITPRMLDKYSRVYRHDGDMYVNNVKCATCKFVKPARSKHCSYCNHCVFRFDHHCVWTNSCIGGGNIRYFLAFLLSVCGICINGSVMVVRALVMYAYQTRITEAIFLRTPF